MVIALQRCRQAHLVSLVDLGELHFALLGVVHIRVVFSRELPERGLKLIFGGIPTHPESLVVICSHSNHARYPRLCAVRSRARRRGGPSVDSADGSPVVWSTIYRACPSDARPCRYEGRTTSTTSTTVVLTAHIGKGGCAAAHQSQYNCVDQHELRCTSSGNSRE